MWSLEEMEKSKIKISLYCQELLETKRSKEEYSPRASREHGSTSIHEHLEFGLPASKPLKSYLLL